MADSYVPITGGSGYNVDTRTESTNAHHRQVIVIGDPSDNGGIAPVDATTGLKIWTATALPAGTNAIGKLAANDGVDIGDVTINNAVGAGVYIRPGSGVNLDTSNVTIASSALPSGAATSAKQDTQITSLTNIETAVQLLDDAVYTDGTGTPSKALAIAGTDGTNPQIISTNSSGHVNVADGGNSITVDGTVAATQSGTWNITDISGTVSLPTGAATSARQDTIITAVQLLDDAVYTDGSGTPSKGLLVMGSDGTNPQAIAVNTDGEVGIHDGGNSISIDDGGNVITVDGTVSVTASTGFPSVVTDGSTAGTNAIHVAGTDGTNAQIISTNSSGHINIADGGNSITVDGTVTATGTVTANAGTGFPPVVTDGSSAGTTGIHILGTDGTNAQLLSTTSGGILNVLNTAADNLMGRVKISDGTDVADVLDLTNSNPLTVAIVDGDGTQITSIGGGTEYAVDAVAGATDTGKLTLAVRDDALATLTPADGDYTQLRTNNRGALWIKSDGDITIADGGNTITVDGTVTANAGTGFAPVVTTGSAAGTTGTHLLGTDGTNARIISTTSSGHVNISDGGNSVTVDATNLDIRDLNYLTDSVQSITYGYDGSGNDRVKTDGNGNLTIVGPQAHDAAILRNPVLLGGYASSAAPTDVSADGDLSRIWTSLKGALNVSIRDSAGDSAMDDTNNALRVNIVAGSSSGTQYTQGDTDASITGTAMLMEGGSDTLLPVQGTVADGLLVNLGSNNDVTVTGTVAVTQSGTWDEVGINDSGNSITVDDGGTSLTVDGTVAATQSGTWSVRPDSYATDDSAMPATPLVFPIGGEYRSTPTTYTNGDATVLQTDVNGNLNVAIWANGDVVGSGNPISVEATILSGDVSVSNGTGASAVNIRDGGNSITVDNDGTFAVQAAQSGTWSVGHNVTGIGHGVTTVTTAGTDVVLASSTACKKVVVQSQTDNTGLIAVGASGVDATEATGTGIILYPGDSMEIQIDNLADIYIDSTVNGEGVRYTYFT